jgi:hypothetical protein
MSVILEQVIYSSVWYRIGKHIWLRNCEFYQRSFVSNSFRIRAARSGSELIYSGSNSGSGSCRKFRTRLRIRIHNTGSHIPVSSKLLTLKLDTRSIAGLCKWAYKCLCKSPNWTSDSEHLGAGIMFPNCVISVGIVLPQNIFKCLYKELDRANDFLHSVQENGFSAV